MWIPLRRGVLKTTLCDNVCLLLATGRWISPGTSLSSTNKTDRYDITEILLKVELNTINQPTNQTLYDDIINQAEKFKSDTSKLVKSLKNDVILIITPYLRILDFDWLIAGVFSYLGLLSFIFTAAGVFAWGFNFFTLACIKPPNSFRIFLLYLYT